MARHAILTEKLSCRNSRRWSTESQVENFTRVHASHDMPEHLADSKKKINFDNFYVNGQSHEQRFPRIQHRSMCISFCLCSNTATRNQIRRLHSCPSVSCRSERQRERERDRECIRFSKIIACLRCCLFKYYFASRHVPKWHMFERPIKLPTHKGTDQLLCVHILCSKRFTHDVTYRRLIFPNESEKLLHFMTIDKFMCSQYWVRVY